MHIFLLFPAREADEFLEKSEKDSSKCTFCQMKCWLWDPDIQQRNTPLLFEVSYLRRNYCHFKRQHARDDLARKASLTTHCKRWGKSCFNSISSLPSKDLNKYFVYFANGGAREIIEEYEDGQRLTQPDAAGRAS